MRHWMPKGWLVTIKGRPHQFRGEASCEGSPTLEALGCRSRREAEQDAVSLLFRWLARNLDMGWTEKTGNRVHLCVKGQATALCGSRLQDSPDIGKIETPQCGRCYAIEGTIERKIGMPLWDFGLIEQAAAQEVATELSVME